LQGRMGKAKRAHQNRRRHLLMMGTLRFAHPTFAHLRKNICA